jgi:hypothetical protein
MVKPDHSMRSEAMTDTCSANHGLATWWTAPPTKDVATLRITPIEEAELVMVDALIGPLGCPMY